MMSTEAAPLTTSEVAEHHGVTVAQARRAIDMAFGFQVQRAGPGSYRLVPRADLPRIREALHALGYLKDDEATGA